MVFKEEHDIKIGDKMAYIDLKGIEKTGVITGIYPHFVQLRSPAGYNVTKLNADLYVEKGWK